MAAASHGYLQVLDDAQGGEMPLITDTGTGSRSRSWHRRNHFNSKGIILPPREILTQLVAYYTPWLDQMLTRAVCIAPEEPFYIALQLDAKADALESSVAVIREQRRAAEARRSVKKG